jgi:hypothetical protein
VSDDWEGVLTVIVVLALLIAVAAIIKDDGRRQ